MELPRYAVIEKAVGETPLAAMESWRLMQNPEYFDVPLTYAGRLDPMASGKLLVLIGEECKKKDEYLALDKTYEFSVLFGIGSDTHDVLGRLQTNTSFRTDTPSEAALRAAKPSLTTSDDVSALKTQLQDICANLTGEVELPYPHFSSRTVQGKPLHLWALEGRLNEIDIPTKKSTIYSLTLDSVETKSRTDVCDIARAKIDTIPEVTEVSKDLGKNFRRTDVRADWDQIKSDNSLPEQYTIAHFTCTASSGTYMRTLAKLIGEKLNQPLPSLAWSIHRTEIKVLEIETQN
ncbi:MAG: tRNA U55 pseudouridine synthase TruB [Candidatus Paceibacteria bacterium]|jgi:tRNA U55 pseudouridine synthase TruB